MPLNSFFGNLFGFKIKPSKEEVEKKTAESFVAPTNEDGAMTVESAAGAYGVYLDLDGAVKDEFELITKYREMSLYPEVDSAIDDVVNEAVVLDGQDPAVSLDLSDVELDENIKAKVILAFDRICSRLNWNNEAYEIFRKWYVDGRLYYHIVLAEDVNKELITDTKSSKSSSKKAKKGILELRYIDPRQIRKIRVVDRTIDENSQAEIVKVVEEYYIYNQRGIQYQGPSSVSSQVAATLQGVKISKDAILYVHSGILDKFSSTILSSLHKAIKPLNQLKMMEDALVIYRITRAPERRIFYIDVGNLPKTKAEDYLRSIMLKYRNKMVYDVNSGEVKDDKRHLSMLEDYWLPRKDGGQGTEIDTLPGGQNLGEMEDVEYFQKKLYKALNVPVSRLDPDSGFTLGRSTEITRDELKFAKMIHRLRLRFSHLFSSLLETELIVTGVLSKDDWVEIQEKLQFNFSNDNHFAELKDNEIIKGRLELLPMVDPDTTSYTKKYFSVEWIRKHILKQTQDEQKTLDKQIKKEKTKYEDTEPKEGEVKNSDDFNFGDSPKEDDTKDKEEP